jgi:glutamyl-tRNA(Gln) amidotransferase subunit E
VRVIAGLDQAPILLSGEKWPDYRGGLDDLRRVRARLHCEEDDAIVVVWGPEEDCITAVNEIRLRYVDATDGVPNETRQPFEDGVTDFERILPGPDRMYPDTDSPPTRVTRDRVQRLKASLPEVPWTREARYAGAGIPRSTIHFLIRRGGAAIVDRVVADCGADLRRAGFLFGERLVGLRRAGVEVEKIPVERWCEFFTAVRERVVLFEAWEIIARRMAAQPADSLETILKATGLNTAPGAWRTLLRQHIAEATRAAVRKEADLVHRLAMGSLMRVLLGKVAASVVSAALQLEIEVTQ